MSDLISIGGLKKQKKTILEIGDLRSDSNKVLTSTVKSVFSKNCIILGDTYTGKTWTASRLIQESLACGVKVICFDAKKQFSWEGQQITNIKAQNFYMPDLNDQDDLDLIYNLANFEQKNILSKVISTADFDNENWLYEGVLQFLDYEKNASHGFDLLRMLDFFNNIKKTKTGFMMNDLIILDTSDFGIYRKEKTIYELLTIKALINVQSESDSTDPIIVFMDEPSFIYSEEILDVFSELVEEANLNHIYFCVTAKPEKILKNLQFFSSYFIHNVKNYNTCVKLTETISRFTQADIELINLLEIGGCLFINQEMQRCIPIQVYSPSPEPNGSISSW